MERRETVIAEAERAGVWAMRVRSAIDGRPAPAPDRKSPYISPLLEWAWDMGWRMEYFLRKGELNGKRTVS